MSDGIIAIIFAVIVFIDSCVIIASFVYSRIVFSNYLRKYHRQEWEKLAYAEPHGFNWFSSDMTVQMYKFRTESSEDFGDANIPKMRKISIYLFKFGIWGWLCLLVIFTIIGILNIIFF